MPTQSAYETAFSALRFVEKDAYKSIDAMADRMRESVANIINKIADHRLIGFIDESGDPYLYVQDTLLDILDSCLDTALAEAIRRY